VITVNQKNFILSLYEELGQEPEVDIDSLTKQEASAIIQELLEIKGEVE